MGKNKPVATRWKTTPTGNPAQMREYGASATAKFLTIGETAFWMRFANPKMSWREISERVSPLERMLAGSTVEEHARRYVERVWLGNEEMRGYLKGK